MLKNTLLYNRGGDVIKITHHTRGPAQPGLGRPWPQFASLAGSCRVADDCCLTSGPWPVEIMIPTYQSLTVTQAVARNVLYHIFLLYNTL